MKRLLGGLLGLTLTIGASSLARADKDRYDVGEEVPSFTLKALNGDEVGDSYISIDRYYGPTAKEAKKALLLSFFATYCEPCKREMPLLGALFESYKAKGLQIVLVSIDKETDKVDFAKTLAKDSGVHFPVLTDRFNIVAKRFFVAKLPNSYLINGEGKVLMANVGYNEDLSKRLVEEIRKAIGEPTSEPLPESVTKHMAKAGSGPESVTVPDESAPSGAEPAGGTATATTATSGSTTAATAPAATTDSDAATTEGAADNAKGKAKGKGKGKAKGKGKGKGK